MPLQEVSLALDKGRKRGNAVSDKVLCLGHDPVVGSPEASNTSLSTQGEQACSQKQVEPDHMVSHFKVRDGGGACDYCNGSELSNV